MEKITVETTVKASLDKVWDFWNEPKHITKWCQASSDWHAPHAENDLRTGGRFKTRMEAKDGSMGFDFEASYSRVSPKKIIEYTLRDGRQVSIHFSSTGTETKVVEIFDPETENPVEMQKGGWQAILDSFKNYTEGN